ncbi:uncharacterized protein A4U43_C07F28330 [Asparagus officinalis]|uniref:Uncharacterized protein n=1 Tax=Asparagus officinalis TaxID=4686 RepID=A0A5P1EFM7_ASPOF|nr:uncharacterized protein A4U43_C07F28330 [Asparagus officinalis]
MDFKFGHNTWYLPNPHPRNPTPQNPTPLFLLSHAARLLFFSSLTPGSRSPSPSPSRSPSQSSISISISKLDLHLKARLDLDLHLKARSRSRSRSIVVRMPDINELFRFLLTLVSANSGLCEIRFLKWSSLLSSWKGATIASLGLLLVTSVMHFFILFTQSERSSTPAKVVPSRFKKDENSGVENVLEPKLFCRMYIQNGVRGCLDMIFSWLEKDVVCIGEAGGLYSSGCDVVDDSILYIYVLEANFRSSLKLTWSRLVIEEGAEVKDSEGIKCRRAARVCRDDEGVAIEDSEGIKSRRAARVCRDDEGVAIEADFFAEIESYSNDLDP